MYRLEEIRSALPTEPLQTVEGLPFPKVATGKVRELFDAGDAWLMIATDRISAFDVILPQGIPGKGMILTQISLFWFGETEGLVTNHLVPDHDARVRELLADRPELIMRSMLVRKLKPLPIEAVARGYLAGSGWKDYVRTGKLFGQPLPEGLRESDKLPVPLFTPTTKAKAGHDMPLTHEQAVELLGVERFTEVRDVSLQLFALGTAAARKSNLLLADTKFEFGTDEEGNLVLIDEVLTPDSSRFWPAEHYQPGGAQPAYDKQFVRDYLESLTWDKAPPAPDLPENVVQGTLQRYWAALEKLVRQ
ncbi:MAG: phosphoribosylaminoimidazolesuccinocarboxamide synthase [Verrucomicrobiota bacterium JB022]|nr:phosphoribosylaminoimidazolesuccinocarboxamide synthase [Verrucomicrobiota bacterium JB022]